MATVKFNLRKANSSKEEPIYLIFRHKNKKLVYSIGFKVIPKYWNKESEEVRNTTNVPNKHNINNLINDLRTEVKRFASRLLEEREPVTPKVVRGHLEKYTGKVKEKDFYFFSFVNDFISRAETVVNISTGKRANNSTIQTYKRTRDILIEYDKSQKRKVDFDTIDLDFYQDFIFYLEKEKFALNTIGKHIKNLKTFLNAATQKGINQNLAYKSRQFKVLKEESDNVYLSSSELDKILKHDLSKNKRLERVRDLFLVGAWTGLRVSDFTRIEPEDIKDRVLIIEQKKVGKRVTIPISEGLQFIFDKYQNNLPTDITIQKINEYIKEVCELAKITEPVKSSITKGGEKITKVFQKWEKVTTHTARRSFATNAYKDGWPILSIMAITGHKTESAFMKYINLSGEEHARLIMEHWAKSGNTMRAIK